jgi:hypothetical protein
VGVEGGILPVLAMILCVPVVGAVAAVCSGGIAGRSRRHAWLWPRAVQGPDVRTVARRGRLRTVVDLLWN